MGGGGVNAHSTSKCCFIQDIKGGEADETKQLKGELRTV